MIKEFVCTVCPRGCRLTVDTEKMTVGGNTCKRGENYGIAEATHPTRTLTSTVRITGGGITRCPVKTASPIPKEMMPEIMTALNAITAVAPVKVGDIIAQDICGTGVNVTATKNIPKI